MYKTDPRAFFCCAHLVSRGKDESCCPHPHPGPFSPPNTDPGFPAFLYLAFSQSKDNDVLRRPLQTSDSTLYAEGKGTTSLCESTPL